MSNKGLGSSIYKELSKFNNKNSTGSFTGQKVLVLMKFSLSIFPVINYTSEVRFKIAFSLALGLKNAFLYFKKKNVL